MKYGEELLTRYEEKAKEHIFLDGIVDKEEYGKCSPKILVILRAGYNEGDKNKMEKDFDLRDFLYNGAQGKEKKGTWRNFPEWLYSLCPETFHEEDDLATTLRKIAVINIKKVPDRIKTSSDKEVRDAAKKYGECLTQQIEEINPDIIIIAAKNKGLDEKVLQNIFEERDEQQKRATLNYFYCYIEKKRVLVLNTYHPSRWYKGKKKMLKELRSFKVN